MNRIRIVIAFILTIVLSLVSSKSIFAEDFSYAMSLSPMSQKIILSPGEKYKSAIEITNPSSSTQDLDYKISIGSFSQYGSDDSQDDYDNVDTTTITDYNQIMNWISFDEITGSVSPNHTKTVPFTIDVPDDAPAGGQYATIMVQDVTDYGGKIDSNIAIKSVSQIGSIIYAEIAGTTIRVGNIAENNIPSFITTGDLTATSIVHNNGNVHTDAEYILQVWPIFSGEEICTNEENSDKSLILPKTERYHTQNCKLPPIGIFKAKQIVRIFNEESIVEKTIIVCPIWLLFIIIFVIVALIIWIILRAKNRGSRRRAEA